MEKNNSADAEDTVEESMKKRLKLKNDAVDIDYVIKTKKCLSCCICCSEFSLNNHLHKHIQRGCVKLLKTSVISTETTLTTSMILMQTTSKKMIVVSQKSTYVRLTVTEVIHNDYEF